MKKRNFVFLFIVLLSCANPIFSQDDFIQFTHYDQLTWSPSGKQIAFRCLLLDESNPENISVNVLIKDLVTGQLTCQNPTPERFIISKNKKFILFSDIYGLYIQTIGQEPKVGQVIFQVPTTSWLFKDYGFYEETGIIYVEHYDYLSGQTSKENFWIDFAKLDHYIDKTQTIKKLNKTKKSKPFNLAVDRFLNKTQKSVFLKNISLLFEKNKTVDFDLVLKDSGSKDTLINNCRPRLLSTNSNFSDVIVSVFEKDGSKTYHFDVESKKFSLIDNQQYYSISWLDNFRYVCINEDGLFLKKINGRTNKKLDDWILPEWCQNIDLSFPKYELQLGFVETKNEAEQFVKKLALSGFPARKKLFKDKKRTGYRIRVGGFKRKQNAQRLGEKLKKKGYDYWIVNIDNLFDFYNSNKFPESKSFAGQVARIEYQKEEFLRSRIVLINKDGTRKIIVDETNNVPDRSHFKDQNYELHPKGYRH